MSIFHKPTTPIVPLNGPVGGGGHALAVRPHPLPPPPLPEWALQLISEAALFAEPAVVKRAVDEYLDRLDKIGLQYQETFSTAELAYRKAKDEADQAFRRLLLRE